MEMVARILSQKQKNKGKCGEGGSINAGNEANAFFNGFRKKWLECENV